jgi:glycosyltransferase involved in cell wall biosynthesis
MKILVLTDDSISFSHGTGAVLLKILRDQPPENLAHGYLNRISEPALEHAFQIDADAEATNGPAAVKCFWKKFKAINFKPDLIYANFYGLRGIRILHAITIHITDLPPIIQHFHDLRLDTSGELLSLLNSMQKWLARIWALTPHMASFIEAHITRPVDVFITFCAPLPAKIRTHHRPLGPDFRAVMLGNIWLPRVVGDLRRAWKNITCTTPGLGPIKWFSHPFALKNIMQNGQVPGNEIRHMGFAPDLEDVLSEADLAIVPFNRKSPPENDYARFSLPSRLSELTMAGLPIFALACPDTTVWNFVHDNRIGKCACPMNPVRLEETLLQFMQGRGSREIYGHNAFIMASTEFDIKKLTRKYFDEFYAVKNIYVS